MEEHTKVSRTLTGQWRGEYAYAAEVPITASSMKFEMSLDQLSFGRILGSISDVGLDAGRRESTVRGWRIGSAIRFTKTYSDAWATTEDGRSVRASDWLSEQNFRPIHGERFVLPPHRVQYSGRVDSAWSHMQGAWRIRPYHLRVRQRQQVVWVSIGAFGSWFATRLSD